ncbi:hypothetical protein SAMN02982990_02275 [Photorhabdus luminescens]|uniref:Uncharacterized protein n=1 Tax=Photorhabdus luminescens TaxID=29488 RepID=A0A1G5QT46_PHOLU|nr:hypothetical protein SAMN02982990_02275 [Photorhabdus luminescens]
MTTLLIVSSNLFLWLLDGATYIEATFSDGYVATTQVYITPDDKYPTVAPLSNGPTCQTLPGRGGLDSE